MKYKSGDKVWAISYRGSDSQMPAAGEYAGVVEDFFDRVQDEDGSWVEYYGVDIPSMPSSDGGWIISERCLRPRDDPDDLPGDTTDTPDKKSSWDSFKLWRPAELDVKV